MGIPECECPAWSSAGEDVEELAFLVLYFECTTGEQYIPKEVTKCSCALRVFMHRLFLKSQTRRVLSSAQLKINFPPEWNRTPRTQLSWPTLCTRRHQWADACFKVKQTTIYAMASWVTPRPLPVVTAFSILKLLEFKVYLQFLLLHLYQRYQQCEFLSLKASKQEFPCALHWFCSSPPARTASSVWAQAGKEQPQDHHIERTFYWKQNSDDYQQFHGEAKFLSKKYTTVLLHLHYIFWDLLFLSNKSWNTEAIKTVFPVHVSFPQL